MSSRWQKTFEIAVPVERVWQAFTDPEELAKLYAAEPDEAGNAWPDTRVLEAEPLKKLRWAQESEDLPEKAEFEVVFESTEGGSRITVTRHGFGEGELAEIFSKANGLGWEHGLRDLVLYLETGQLVKRHHYGAGPSRMGMAYAETDAGLEVREVLPGGFAEKAGLAPGDRLVRMGGAAVYRRSELWLINALFEPGHELDVEFVRGRELLHARAPLSTHDTWGVGE